MKKTRTIILSLTLLLLFAHLPLSTGWAVSDDERGIRIKRKENLRHGSGQIGSYTALIIGINDYADERIPDLKTAVKDAQEMAALLAQKYGFTTRMLLDRKADKEGIYKAMRELSVSAKPQDSLLIYYAGHGDLDRDYNDGWWIPADAEAGNPVTYLDNTQVQKAMRATKARHALLISDSCYSGTLFGQGRDMPRVIDDRYYLSLYNETSRWGMTSGNKTPVSDIGTDGHSVFAYQLLKELRKNDKPFLSTQEIYTRIAPIIANNSEQTPMCRPIKMTGDQGGEFVFILADSGGVVEPIHQPVTVGPTQGDVWKDPVAGMEFVYVKGGCYQMGDIFGDGRSNEKPVHKVCVDDFWMGKFEVTQGQWRKVMGIDPPKLAFKNCGDNCPVERVSWNDIQEFIEKLNRKNNGNQYRLPTEAEWEYAARSGGRSEKYAGFSDERRLYQYGNFCDKSCENSWKDSGQDDGFQITTPVGQYKPNGLGIYDMSGNVWEWCQDWYDSNYYKNSPRDNPTGPSSGSSRVIRGGSWSSPADYCHSALRNNCSPGYRDSHSGFRLLRTP